MFDRATNSITNGFETGLISWYDFRVNSNLLYIGDEYNVALHNLELYGVDVTYITVDNLFTAGFSDSHIDKFDYIVCPKMWEKSRCPLALLQQVSSLLKDNGILLLGMNNRLGLRFFCGDSDLYTGRTFDGICNYDLVNLATNDNFTGRLYDKRQTTEWLKEAGFVHSRFYSVLPNLDNPFLIYAEDYIPNENLATRIMPAYHTPDTVFLKEETLYQSLIDNNLFHKMANSYIIECSKAAKLSDVLQVTASIERGRQNALFTVIYGNNTVKKRAVYPEGSERLKILDANMKELSSRGVGTVRGEFDGRCYAMPYMSEKIGQMYLKELFHSDTEKFLQKLDLFQDTILRSSTVVKTENQDDDIGVVLERGYIDLVPLNSFYVNGEYVFFDQEFCVDNLPAKAIMYRTIVTFYGGGYELNNIIPMQKLLERYDLVKNLALWEKINHNFLVKLRQENELAAYHVGVRRDTDTIVANRNRMNYSQLTYEKHIRTMLDKADTRKLILFGSGKYAQNFLLRFGRDYPVYAIVDNDEKRHGERLGEIEIHSADFLRDLTVGEYKVIICVKDYKTIAEQLENMRIFFYGIYNPAFSYSFNHRLQDKEKIYAKPFHIGYVAGVFDLFHIGHLNILRRAKEHCDYLIVGVVSDRQVREYKKVEPFVPFNERLDMVRSCKYVDEAHEIPFEAPDTDMAWKLYRFDAQFSGSDYENDPVWLKKKEWLEERGSTLVFFPYTQSTSSTRLKKLIEERLI